MSTENKVTMPVRREEFNYPAADSGTLIITAGLQREIEWLHKAVGPKEWCGTLFYKRLEGDISDPKTLKLLASHIYPMDIGRETYTEADFDPETMINMWDTVLDPVTGEPDYTYKRGLIHSHHNMTTFFSGTDKDELHDNTGAHNYYLSLIVNFSGIWCAKVAFVAKRKTLVEYTNVHDQTKNFETSKELLMMIDMNIVKEQSEIAVPDFFRSRFNGLKEAHEKRLAEQAAKFATRTHTTSAETSLGFEDPEVDEWKGLGAIAAAARATNKGGSKAPERQGGGAATSKANLERGDRTLRPIGKVEEDILAKIINWLNEGIHICSDMEPGKRFETVDEGIGFFKDYFDEPSHDLVQYNYFIDQLQRIMPTHFSRWFPVLIQRVGMEVFDTMLLGNVLSADVYELFEAYPQYMIEMGHIGKEKKALA